MLRSPGKALTNRAAGGEAWGPQKEEREGRRLVSASFQKRTARWRKGKWRPESGIKRVRGRNTRRENGV